MYSSNYTLGQNKKYISGGPTYPNFLPPTLKLCFEKYMFCFSFTFYNSPGCFILHIYTIMRLQLSQEDEFNAQ